MRPLRRPALVACCLAVASVLAACQSGGPTKEEIDAAKNTIDCDFGGERILIRFAEGEARLLLPDATRVNLYQVAAPTGVRYTDGFFDLRGRGLDFDLTRDRVTRKMICKQYELIKKQD